MKNRADAIACSHTMNQEEKGSPEMMRRMNMKQVIFDPERRGFYLRSF